jgi:hypothetical protein
MQAEAQLNLLAVQARQLQEQGKEQVRELEELEREQIEQLKGEANRQIEQARRQGNRQIEQVSRHVTRQLELLAAQMRLVEAQAGIPAEARKAMRQALVPLGKPSSPESREAKKQPAVSPSAEERLDKILDRLERLERRLDRLEKAR